MSSYEKYSEIINSFHDKKILVVGDIMLDVFRYGYPEKISPEDQGIVYKHSREIMTPGGAGNVAENIIKLDGKPYIISVIGNDIYGDNLVAELKENSITPDFLIIDKKRTTSTKVRYIDARFNHSCGIRWDYEKNSHINSEIESKLIKKFDGLIRDMDAIILSDYRKGVLTHELVKYIIKKSGEKKVIVDPKPDEKDGNIEKFRKAEIIKPNQKEMKTIKKYIGENDMEKIAEKLDVKYIIETKGENGMTVTGKNYKKHIPATDTSAYATEIMGAGDTVIAGLGLSIASGANIEEAAYISNVLGGIVVTKKGTATVTRDELKEKINEEIGE